MRKFLFLIAWVDGSDSDDVGTEINEKKDLLPGWLNRNQHINGWEIEADEPYEAENEGYRKAFFANFTAHDSVSDVYEWIDGGWQSS